MKFVKGISLYLLYPSLMLGIGFLAGARAEDFFYPGNAGQAVGQESAPPLPPAQKEPPDAAADRREGQGSAPARTEAAGNAAGGVSSGDFAQAATGEGVFEAAAHSAALCADTEYVLEETDTLTHSVVETLHRLPRKYIGMNREQFLAAMESYAAYPPLSEKERGFIGLEVLSFSKERVVVQMNYRYLQPGSSFYLAVENNELVVYLEDKETIYINTGILLEDLPEDVQMQVIQMIWVEDEKSLYGMLEAYTS